LQNAFFVIRMAWVRISYLGNMVDRSSQLLVAVVSDIHGNLTAFEAVLADLRRTSPDLVLHGGDLADGGSSPVAIVDRIRDLGWQGVMGNTDEMLVRPSSLEDFANQSSGPPALWSAIRRVALATISELGEERLAWMRGLPRVTTMPGFTLVHASPGNCWHAPAAEATNGELEAIYGSLGTPIVAFGHTHRPAIRKMTGPLKQVINTGSVGLPYDGDPRACYLLLDGTIPSIRRVEYSMEKELKALSSCGLPGAEWTARMLRTSSPLMP
jgi:predicted phosphodiesterase